MGRLKDGTKEGTSKEDHRQEASCQEASSQEASSKEDHREEGSCQEDHREEASSKEASSEEDHCKEGPRKEEDRSQEGSCQEDHQEVNTAGYERNKKHQLMRVYSRLVAHPDGIPCHQCESALSRRPLMLSGLGHYMDEGLHLP